MTFCRKPTKSIPLQLDASIHADLKAAAVENQLTVEEVVRIAVIRQLSRGGPLMQTPLDQAESDVSSGDEKVRPPFRSE